MGGDIARHYNPRFDQGQVVRNTNVGGWRGEEGDGGFPFTKKVRCFMTILIEADCFRVCPASVFNFHYNRSKESVLN